jgi:hypothetical protein
MTMKIRNRKMWALAVLAGAVLAMSGCSGPAVVPAAYNTYNSDDGTFQIQYPAEWKVEGGGTRGYNWAKFTSGSAQILVESNVAGSLVADISKIGSPVHVTSGQAEQPDRAPVAVVHEHERQGFEEDEGVQEQEPVILQTALSEARKSEFTGARTFGGAIRGYRATALSSENRIRVVCQCSESQWEALTPAFDKVIASVARGKPQF